MSLQAILFDVDGTLIDSVDLHALAWQEAMAHFGKDVRLGTIREHVGMGGDQLVKLFFTPAELKRVGPALDTYRDRLFQKRYMRKINSFPAVPSLFTALSQRMIRTALASSAKKPELRYYKRLIGIAPEGQTSSDDAQNSKPEPDIFEAALRTLGRPDPKSTLVIGDSPYDALAARKAGLHAVGVRCGGFPDGRLWDAGCVALFNDPADLLRRLPVLLALR